MRNLVLSVALAAIACAGLAVVGMVLIALQHDGDLAQTVIGDLQAIAMAVIPTIAVVISHYIGAQAQAQASTPAAPTPEPPSAPGGA